MEHPLFKRGDLISPIEDPKIGDGNKDLISQGVMLLEVIEDQRMHDYAGSFDTCIIKVIIIVANVDAIPGWQRGNTNSFYAGRFKLINSNA